MADVKKRKVIGIDLGTTNSCVAVYENGSPQVIHNNLGKNTTPSYVSLKNKEIQVGESAKGQAVINPKNTFYVFKRFMGRSYDSISNSLKEHPVAYQVSRSSTGPGVVIKGSDASVSFTPEELSSKILMKLKKDAEDYLGYEVKEAVITVPAYFDDIQRQATKDAGQIAGLDVLRIINEPTAAALAYGFDGSKDGTVVVYDLGGGTFDVSILVCSNGVFEVKATNGDNYLGGSDFDNCLVNYLADNFKKKNGVDLRQDAAALQRLRQEAENAKIALSNSQIANVNIPYITGQLHLEETVTRTAFENMVAHLIEKTILPCKKVLEDAKISVDKIDKVVLVGGMTRMPKVISTVEAFFRKAPDKGVNPDEVVACGAAIQAGVLQKETGTQDILLLDVVSLSLGIETLGGAFTKLIERNTTIPAKKSQVFSTAADNQTSVSICVYQGERPIAKDNKFLGQFDLNGIPSAPRGVPQIDVSFDLDANGILKVTAKELKTGKVQDIVIKGSGSLSQEEIKRMQEEAEMYAEKDKERIRIIELRNKSESSIFAIEKTLRENEDKIPAELKTSVENAIKDLNDKLQDSNSTAEVIEASHTALENEAMKIYESIQSSQNSAESNQNNTSEQDSGAAGSA